MKRKKERREGKKERRKEGRKEKKGRDGEAEIESSREKWLIQDRSLLLLPENDVQ
jgi:hypothetical protein